MKTKRDLNLETKDRFNEELKNVKLDTLPLLPLLMVLLIGRICACQNSPGSNSDKIGLHSYNMHMFCRLLWERIWNICSGGDNDINGKDNYIIIPIILLARMVSSLSSSSQAKAFSSCFSNASSSAVKHQTSSKSMKRLNFSYVNLNTKFFKVRKLPHDVFAAQPTFFLVHHKSP
jgi:hypothetical protein